MIDFKKYGIDIEKMSVAHRTIITLIWLKFHSLLGEDTTVQKMHKFLAGEKADKEIIVDLQREYDRHGPEMNSQYQHINGGDLVEVVGNSIDEETFNHMVLYHHVGEAVIWSRKHEIFKTRFKPYKRNDSSRIIVSCINDPRMRIVEDELITLVSDKDQQAEWYRMRLEALLSKLKE